MIGSSLAIVTVAPGSTQKCWATGSVSIWCVVAWLFVVMGTDHSSYWEFAPGSIAKKYWFTDAAESYTSPQVETSRQSDDIFVHRLLQLRAVDRTRRSKHHALDASIANCFHDGDGAAHVDGVVLAWIQDRFRHRDTRC